MEAEGVREAAAADEIRSLRSVRGRHVVARVLRPRRGYVTHRVLADPVAHRDLARHGYHVTDVVVPAQVVRELRTAADGWLEANPIDGEGRFHSSFEPSPTPAGTRARQAVIEHLLPVLEATTVAGSRLRPSVFQCKPPGPASGLQAHQDAFLVDERAAYGLFAWVALTDITIDDGPLVVLPGSHRYGTWTRVSTETDDLAALHPTIERHARALLLRAGQVVWFDNALVHGSLPNAGPALRLAVSAVAVPEGVDIMVPQADHGGRPTSAALYRLDPHLVAGATTPALTDGELLGRVGLDTLDFGPVALGLASRLQRALRPGASGVRLPRGTSCLALVPSA